jgi:uncharacterized membrane protein
MMRWMMFALLVAACTSSSSSGIAAQDVVCPTDSTLTYESFGSAFLSDNCLSCHASKDRPVLTTRGAVAANKDNIVSAAVTSTKMPANGSIGIEERQLLGEWLACGAP